MFNVTYDIVTQESAGHGDVEERGFICEGVSLRYAMTALFETRTAHVDGITCIEANEYPVSSPRWVTVVNGMEYLTGAVESRSIHFPETITDASRKRIYKLIKGS